MYPILLLTFSANAAHPPATHQYPDEVPSGFKRVALLSYCRSQAEAAIRESGGLADIDKTYSPMLRWRAIVPETPQTPFNHVNINDSRLELFLMDDESAPMRRVYSAPLCGPEFKALPLVLRLGLELLIRKECRGKDPE
jgi:hypothetical protein